MKMMQREISEAIAQTGLPENKTEGMIRMAENGEAEELTKQLRIHRKELLDEIYEKDEQIRRIDWIIYHLK